MQRPNQAGSRIDQLTEEIRNLRRHERRLRTIHTTELRELRSTIATYANQIQVLTLRNVELTDEANMLREKLAREQPTVRSLRSV